ncbi:hypothetical protein [Falsiroseomonas tokyonensis]|uniref:Uncharacterized protein n=1 Tax=Falsiroseomonas tokyonensis TaxID=430521 RepID=A0ABV7C157_9PROT|nr:hypothetical protein [Falsiroseomonas tokyonensis]MBU8540195.1 hypothetical protein [Falsiroseomonas tokyonensis]
MAEGVDYEALADHLVASAADPVAAQLLRPVLPGMLEARVQAAHLAGAAGVPDWAALTRMMKLPFATAATQAKAGRQVHVHLGERLARAMMARGEAATRVVEGVAEAIGRDEVTVAALEGG